MRNVVEGLVGVGDGKVLAAGGYVAAVVPVCLDFCGAGAGEFDVDFVHCEGYEVF